MKEELLKGLTEEQITKLKSCSNAEEILSIAKEEGIELTDEQLETVSGGSICAPVCPFCGTKDDVFKGTTEETESKYVCKRCGRIVGDYGL